MKDSLFSAIEKIPYEDRWEVIRMDFDLARLNREIDTGNEIIKELRNNLENERMRKSEPSFFKDAACDVAVSIPIILTIWCFMDERPAGESIRSGCFYSVFLFEFYMLIWYLGKKFTNRKK